MKEQLAINSSKIAWGLGLLVSLLAIFVWGNDINWDFSGASLYLFFPPLGLIAFSLMWSHYILNAVNEYTGAEKDKTYSSITTYVVFLALLLHPMLFFLQLYIDGFGTPPESYVEFLGDSFAKFAALGTAAWLAFMAYEFRGWLENRGLIWRLILLSNAIAMVLVFIHGLKLGSNLQSGFYMGVWWLYGVSLAVSYIYLFVRKKLF